MPIAEIVTGLTGIKTALDILKGLKSPASVGPMAPEISELWGAIIDAQIGLSTANQVHSEDVERIRNLESEVANFTTWNTEKERYELKDIGNGAVAYMLKLSARGTEPPHWACQNCFEQGRKRMFQPDGEMPGRYHIFKCPGCNGTMRIREMRPRWVD